MAVKILGINDSHNAAVALLVDGEIKFAIQEERLTRLKNQGGIPYNAIIETLKRTGYQLSDIDFFAMNGQYMTYYHSYNEALLETFAKSGSLHGELDQRLRSYAKKIPFIYDRYREQRSKERFARLSKIGIKLSKVISVEHHTAHAAAAYYGLGLEKPVLVLTCDGSGDRLSGSVSIGQKGRLERIAAIGEDESIGQVYSLVTYLMGMMPLDHEYKVMGLAPYAEGNETNVDRIYKKFASLFDINGGSPFAWKRRPGVPPIFASSRLIEKLLRRERFDCIAAGLQKFIEVFISTWVQRCVREIGIRTVALSGGVFMNVKLNKRILELSEVEELFVFPSCGDETNSIGAAYWVYANQSQGNGSEKLNIKPIRDLYWGGDFSEEQVEQSIKNFKLNWPVDLCYHDDIELRIAELLAQGEVVARAKGRMEFGARSLGNRSILANPSKPKVVKVINEMIKMRDFWMPFAPSVLGERADDYYIKPKAVSAPYMILTFDTKPHKVDALLAAAHPYDHTIRPQEVYQEWNSDYHRLLKNYEVLTGEGAILNTSFNLHGFPIVYSPNDALEVFNKSGLRHLALGNFLLSKKS